MIGARLPQEMLPFQQEAMNLMIQHQCSLSLFGRGLDSIEIINQMIITSLQNNKQTFVFGLNEEEKKKITLMSDTMGTPTLPVDMEKEIGKKERIEKYQTYKVIFHNPILLAKDFLERLIDAQKITGFIIANAEKIHNNNGLQLCIAYYKSNNPTGFIHAFSEKCYEFGELRKIADLLWIRYIFLYPRFEQTVKESITAVNLKKIKIILKQQYSIIDVDQFSPNISKELSDMYKILIKMLKSFITEYGNELNLKSIKEVINSKKKTIEKRAKTDEQKQILESALFFRRAIFLLLHSTPEVFIEYINDNRPTQGYHPYWATMVETKCFLASANSYSKKTIPSPKLQWILHLLTTEAKDKRTLILARGRETTEMIENYLAGFNPLDNSDIKDDVTLDEWKNEKLILDQNYFQIIEAPMIIVRELHSQEYIYDLFRPDCIICWGLDVITLRKIEIYNSKNHANVVCFFLYYEDINELDAMDESIKHENEVFIKYIKSLQTLTLAPYNPFSTGNKKIIVDEREFRSGFPFALFQVGFQVIPALLVVGDYVLTNDIVIERKSYNDLVSSIRSGRLVQQLQRMQKYYAKPILLLEFTDVDYNSICESDILMEKVMTTLTNFPVVKVVWGRNCIEAARTLLALSNNMKSPDLKKAVQMGIEQNDNTEKASKNINFLNSLSFLSPEHINTLLTKCQNLQELVQLPRDEMMNTIDAKTAVKLYSFLHNNLKHK